MTVLPSHATGHRQHDQVPGLLRLVVLGPTRRAELVVPSRLPVVDLLPDLARAVGLLDATLVHGGYRLVRGSGTVLDPGRDLATQEVADGSVLTVEAGAHDEPERAYDDVVEAVADAVESTTRPWTPDATRRSALAAAAVLLVSASAALGLERHEGAPVSAAGGILAVLLLAGAAVLGRRPPRAGTGDVGDDVRSVADGSSSESAVVVAWLAVAPAAVAGLAILPDAPLADRPLLYAGAAGLAATVLGFVALPRMRSALLPALGLSLLAVLVGALDAATDLHPADVVAVAVGLSVLLGGLVPALAVSRSRIRTPAPADAARTGSSHPGTEVPVDRGAVEDAVGSGRAVLLGLAVTVGVLVAVAGPFLAHLGVSGLVLGVVLAAVVLLRSRRSRARSDVAVQLLGGVAALAALAVSAALVHPGWRTALAGALVGAGVVLLLASSAPARSRLWLGRAADVVEGVALVAVLPLVVLAVGLVSAVRS